MATNTAAPPQAKKAPRPRSFLVGTQGVVEGADYDQTFTIGANGQQMQPWALQATGWLRGLYILITGTGVTVGTVVADGPWIGITNIQLNDVNQEALFGPFDGYTAMLTNKYGGYFNADDPNTTATFAYTGGTTTANVNAVLYIPLEIVSRDPLGPIASVNNTASLTMVWSLGPIGNWFTTVTGTLAIRVRGNQDFYFEPRPTDLQGNPIADAPPAAGTTQYWTQGSVSGLGGAINQSLLTALGYQWRNYLFLARGSDTTRATGETNWPDPVTGIKFEANFIFSNIAKTLWQDIIARMWDYTNGTADVRGSGSLPGHENGVYMLNFNADFFKRTPGGESRKTYLVTSPGSNFIFNGSFGSTGNSLYSIVNYVAPGGGSGARSDSRSLTGGN